MQVWQVGEEIISDKHREHNEIINNALEVVVERQRWSHFSELEVQILAQERQMKEIKIN